MIAITAGILMAGCSKTKDGMDENIVMDVATLADQLKEGITFKDDMSLLEDDIFSMVYNIDMGDIVNKKIYLSAGATAEEIAVIEGKDSESVGRIVDGLEQKIEDQKVNFESYVPEEMKKLEDPVLVKEGNYVILCISDDNEKALDIIEKAKQ